MIQLSLEGFVEDEHEAISYSKLNTALFCRHAYYLQYIEGIDRSKIPMLGYTAKGFFIHNRIKDLFKQDKSLKFKSPEKFANCARNWWKQYICLRGRNIGIDGGKWHNKEIVWNHEGQWWSFADDVWRACYNYYKSLEEEGYTKDSSPIVYREEAFSFVADGRRFIVSFDEIRKGMLVREQKVKSKSPSKKKLDEDLQLTFQVLGFCSRAHNIDSFRIKCGVSEELADSWGGNPYFVSDAVNAQIQNLMTGEILSTKRSNQDFYRLMGEIDSLDEMVMREEFFPNHKSCKVCQFNVFDEGRVIVCKEKNPKVETPNVYIP